MLDLFHAVILSLFPLSLGAKPQIISSCPPSGVSVWNEDSIGAHLRSWLKSVTTVKISEEDGLKSMRYYPTTDKYGPHFDTEDLSDLVVLPADAPDRKRQTVQEPPEEEEDLVDRDAEKGRVTLGHFKSGRPHGLAWQWQSERMLEGFLYGDLEAGGGGFTGPDLLYIYPDLETGLRGRFEAGEAVAVRAVTVTSERCSQGVKELRTRETEDATTWRRRLSDTVTISEHPLVTEPHEARAVFIGDSKQVCQDSPTVNCLDISIFSFCM